MSADLITTILTYVTAAIGAATLILQGIAVFTKITPTTKDDEIVSTAQSVVKKIQSVLGMLALDTGSTHKSG